jgi:hypothetical protein
MQKIITGGAIALALLGGAADAQAIEWSVTKYDTARRTIYADACAGPGATSVKAPAYARNLVATGQEVKGRTDPEWADYDDDSEIVKGPVIVTGIENTGNVLRYTMQPGDWCPREQTYWVDHHLSELDRELNKLWPGSAIPEGHWETSEDPGWVANGSFHYRYEIRKRLALKGRAAALADTAMSRASSWWDYTEGWPQCKVHGNRARCIAGAYIGDGAVSAVVKLRLIPRTGNAPVWSYKVSGRQIDEYCKYVTHGSNCTKRIKKQRNRVSLPYWVRAKNA